MNSLTALAIPWLVACLLLASTVVSNPNATPLNSTLPPNNNPNNPNGGSALPGTTPNSQNNSFLPPTTTCTVSQNSLQQFKSLLENGDPSQQLVGLVQLWNQYGQYRVPWGSWQEPHQRALHEAYKRWVLMENDLMEPKKVPNPAFNSSGGINGTPNGANNNYNNQAQANSIVPPGTAPGMMNPGMNGSAGMPGMNAGMYSANGMNGMGTNGYPNTAMGTQQQPGVTMNNGMMAMNNGTPGMNGMSSMNGVNGMSGMPGMNAMAGNGLFGTNGIPPQLIDQDCSIEMATFSKVKNFPGL